MTFLNFVLLGGVAAALIPLIIHLFHRNRFRVVRWAAMHLLEPLQRSQRRRLKLEQLLLLLVRCAIPAVLALCMARPVLTGLEALAGRVRTSLVVLLDNSYSMETAHSRPAFDEAREAAAALALRLPRGSEASVVLMGGPPATLTDAPTFNTEAIARALVELEAGDGAADVPSSLELALGSLARMHEAHRELVVLSDFQRISWSDRESAERSRLAAELRSLPVPPSVAFLPLGGGKADNVSVQSLELSRLALGVGQRFQIRADIRNHGEAARSDVRVRFRADGEERAVTSCSLGPGESRQVLFPHQFDAAGSHMVGVEVDAPDPLKSDNAFLASVPVLDRLPVLLVNGRPGNGPLEGETDFLELALQPYNAVKGTLADLVEARVIPPDQLDDKALKDQRVVVLANVPKLDDPRVAALEAYVRAGGGLIVFPGSRCDTAWYNSRLASGTNALLPVTFGAVEGGLDPDAQKAVILSQHFEHPALQLFNDAANGDLSAASIRLWQKLSVTSRVQPLEKGASPSSNDWKSAETAVLATLNTGDPFLVEKKVGDGRVIVCSASCAAEWSNLPLKPAYLPLAQQLVTYLASRFEPPRNLDVGHPLVAALPSALAGNTLQLTDPGGARHAVTAAEHGSRSLVRYENTRRPGLYILELPDGTPIHYVVNASRAESELARLGADEIRDVAAAMGAQVVASLEELTRLGERRRFGREFWRPLLGVLLALLFAELFLQQRARRTAR
jgi:hypothetical protein